MIPFDYVPAQDLDTAIRAGLEPSTRFLAGGTTLIDLMKLEVERPIRVIDLNSLRRGGGESSVSELPDGSLRLGALAHMSDVAWDARVRERYPLVSQSLLLAASGQVRNMATIGGNVLQRTRCPYFRDTATPCNKREPGTGCSALHGINRTHAVLGVSDHCIATHPSDLAVALAALDATVRVRGASTGGAIADRSMPFTALHVLPGTHPERETVLRPGDVITAIDLPALPFARRSLYLKVRDRASFAFALASAAVALRIDGGVIRDARVALGGVGTVPWRSREAERALTGKRATSAAFTAAANAALAQARPRAANAFKVTLAKRVLVRALSEVSA
jgi:xanthine dehydrogenase YagS FAD-binding subunit